MFNEPLDPIKLEEIKKQISTDIQSNDIILYMKGHKEAPQCGFSARVVQILNALDVPYVTRNVLENNYIRQGIKEYTDWPTIPQLYVKGEFIGGCDIVMELATTGELKKIVGAN